MPAAPENRGGAGAGARSRTAAGAGGSPRGSRKVTGLKLGMAPPPLAVGSMEWLEAERADKLAPGTGSGSVQKDAVPAARSGSRKMVMWGMGQRCGR